MKKYLLYACCILALMVSCGPDQPRKTTLTWWHFWTDTEIKPVIKEIVAEFERSHPEVRVELVDLTWADGHDKIAIAFSSGTAPDVVELGSDWIPEFSSTGHLYDLTTVIDSLKDKYMMWDPGLYKARAYAFPWILGTRVLFANRALLAESGFSPDLSPADWDQLYDASATIREKISGVYGFGSNAAERHRLYKKFLPFLWSNGGNILSEDGKTCVLDSPEAIASLEYYLRLCRTGLTDTQRRLEDAFIEGIIGFVISGDWLLKRIGLERPNLDFSTCRIPPPRTGMPSVSFAGGEYLAINAKSPHTALAFALVRHICSPENQLRFCLKNRSANPSAKEVASDTVFLSQPHFDTFVRQMETSRMPPVHPQWVYIEGILEKAIESALYGAKTPAQALREAAAEMREIIAR